MLYFKQNFSLETGRKCDVLYTIIFLMHSNYVLAKRGEVLALEYV
jgi:hypothetical protein